MITIKHNKNKIWNATLKRDIIVRSIPALLTVVAIIFGIIKLSIEFSHENKLEFSRNIYENRLAAYEEIGDIIGHLIVSAENNNDSLFSEYSEIFSILHLKLVPLIMDDKVDKVMGEFIQSIKDYDNDYIQFEEFNILGYTVLKECQLSLKDCYRNLILKNKLAIVRGANTSTQVVNVEN